LGVEIFPGGRRLNERNRKRVERNLSMDNMSSYRGLVGKHEKVKQRRRFDWILLERYDEEL